MRRGTALALMITAPFLLLLAVWQTGRYAALAGEARRLETVQEEWVQENRKLAAGIAVLSSRERTAALAEALGLKKAGPERRLHVVLPSGSGRSDG